MITGDAAGDGQAERVDALAAPAVADAQQREAARLAVRALELDRELAVVARAGQRVLHHAQQRGAQQGGIGEEGRQVGRHPRPQLDPGVLAQVDQLGLDLLEQCLGTDARQLQGVVGAGHALRAAKLVAQPTVLARQVAAAPVFHPLGQSRSPFQTGARRRASVRGEEITD